MADLTIPRETKEFFPVPVYVNSVLTTTFDVAVTRWPARPTTWNAAVVQDGEAGVVVESLTMGTWQVWARVTTATESVVVHAGTLEVT